MSIYIISDTHFSHKNIIKYCDRPFQNIYDMDNAIINNWNSVVNDGDLVYHLGDFCFIPHDRQVSFKEALVENANNLLIKLNGNIILKFGNHDRDLRKLINQDKVKFYNCTNDEIILEDKYILTHYPLEKVPDGMINIHGHIHNNPEVCAMYSKPNYCNVSIEVLNYYPISFDKIKEILSKQ